MSRERRYDPFLRRSSWRGRLDSLVCVLAGHEEHMRLHAYYCYRCGLLLHSR